MKFHSGAQRGADPNFVEIHWRLAQRSSKPLAFGVFTFLGALGLFVAQTGLKSSRGAALTIEELVASFAGTILVAIAAGLLFKFFNKI